MRFAVEISENDNYFWCLVRQESLEGVLRNMAENYSGLKVTRVTPEKEWLEGMNRPATDARQLH